MKVPEVACDALVVLPGLEEGPRFPVREFSQGAACRAARLYAQTVLRQREPFAVVLVPGWRPLVESDDLPWSLDDPWRLGW